MLLNCLQKHSSDFEPKDCAKYFKEQGIDAIISSDYTDDQLVIEVKLAKNPQNPFVFRSYKMDRATKNEILSEYPEQKEALKSCNSIAEITTKGTSEDAAASILLSFLHLHHKAQIIDPTTQKFRGQKALKKLREFCIDAYNATPEKLSVMGIIKKYHLIKLFISVALIIGYIIYSLKANYNTTLILFLIIISLVILWSSSSD